MMNGQKTCLQATEPVRTTLGLRKHAVGRYRLVRCVVARKAVREVTVTRVHFKASPQIVWGHLVFYEEVSERAPLLLRTLLPHPVRTEGDKTQVGAMVRCAYRGGDLIKRITAVEPPHFLKFEVVEQRLGIEDCVLTHGGSYQIHGSGDATDVVLATNYQAYLRPRYLWRPLEALLIHQLHSHILRSVKAALLARSPGRPTRESLKAQSTFSRDLTCTTSQSISRR
jgi:hypothetical protein